MAEPARAVTECGLCGWWQLNPVLDMGDQPLPETTADQQQRYPLALVECGNCGLMQLSHIPPRELVFPPGHPYASGNTRALREHFADLAGSAAGDLEPGNLVVDVGANDATLLGQFLGRGLCLVGVEPTRQIDKRAPGIHGYRDFFTEKLAARIAHDFGSAKLVLATNVLAHVPDPHDFVRGVRRLLRPDGVFVTENHDIASVTEGLQIDTIYHEHLRYYSMATLARLLEMHGLRVCSQSRIPTHGGSFRTFARRAATGLAPRAAAAGRRLRELCASAEMRGDIYGIGATTRATPLIHYAQIAPFIKMVCEVAGSEKIGTVIPGTEIPVVDEKRLLTDQPPYALLLSWHIADHLVPKLRQAGYEGKFIIPLPEPRITDA